MAGLHPQLAIHDLGRVDFLVAGRRLALAHVVDQLLEQCPAVGMPEHGAGRLFLEMEEIELASDAPMIALLGFLEPQQVFLQLLFVGPGRAVDPLQHGVLRIAAPIGSRDLGQLEGAELARRRHMRAAAQVFPVALPVQRDRLARGDGGDDLGLVVLADGLEMLDRRFARQHAPVHRLVGLRELVHLRLEFLEVLRREGPLEGEVVIETVVDDRADRHLRIRVDRLHRLRQKVRRRVPDDLEALGVLRRDDPDPGVVVDHVRQVDQPAVHGTRKGGPRQALADGRRDLGDGHRAVEGPLAAVR